MYIISHIIITFLLAFLNYADILQYSFIKSSLMFICTRNICSKKQVGELRHMLSAKDSAHALYGHHLHPFNAP